MKNFTKKSKKSALVMLCAALGLTGCLGGEGSNTQTFVDIPAVMGEHTSGRPTLATPYGEIHYVGSKLDVGDCVLIDFKLDSDNQPLYATEGILSAEDLKVTIKIEHSPATLIEEEKPDTTGFTFPMTDYMPVCMLKNKLFVVFIHQMFKNQEVEYRLELVKTAEYTYDAYLMTSSSESASGVTTYLDRGWHVFELSREWFPEFKETDTTFPYITLNVKYFVGGEGENAWRSFSGNPSKIYWYQQ
ncbi:hypothetical protein AGMMS4957_08220 [Bacteroidia bacterium]|nr:hypothetical protein AGMMS4957_08220 [Bacteroidia bacterium]